MVGRHAARVTGSRALLPRVLRPFTPVLVAVAVASVLGGAAATFGIDAGPHRNAGIAEAAPVSVVAPAATASRTGGDRASRGGVRSDPAPATPVPSRTPATGSGTCGASYYADSQVTANGELFDPDALTAAHRSWPFNTRVRVTNPATGRSVVVRVNDRGPYVAGRCLDLSQAAFQSIANLSTGVITVRYEVLG